MIFLESMINVPVPFIMLLYFYGLIDTVGKFISLLNFIFFNAATCFGKKAYPCPGYSHKYDRYGGYWPFHHYAYGDRHDERPVFLYAWIAGAFLSIVDAMIWSELGAAFPRAGGSYNFLKEAY